MRLETPPTLTDGSKHFFEGEFKGGNHQVMTVKKIFQFAVAVQMQNQKEINGAFVDKGGRVTWEVNIAYFIVSIFNSSIFLSLRKQQEKGKKKIK